MRSRIVQGFGVGILGLYLTLAASGACFAQECVGDCNSDGAVTIDELILNVNIALGTVPLGACPAGMCADTLPLAITCLVGMVNNALNGCQPAPSPTNTPSVPYPLSGLQEPCGEETGEALLARVRPGYSGTVTPRPEGPWAAPFSFTLQLTYRSGTITCYPAFVPPPGSDRPFIPAHVGVVLEVQFTTANGAFAETVDTELGDLLSDGYTDFAFDRRPDDIQGTYRPDLPGYQDVLVGISATLKEDSAAGVIDQTGIPPGKVSEYIPIAYWVGTALPN